MKIRWERDKGSFQIDGGDIYSLFSVVHPVGDSFRVLHDRNRVMRSITKEHGTGVPADPRPFPKGVWEVTGVEKWDAGNAKYYGDWNIRTDAYQLLTEWALDGSGGYDHALDEQTDDYRYSLHYSIYKTSLGCGISQNKVTIDCIAGRILAALNRHEKITLEVV